MRDTKSLGGVSTNLARDCITRGWPAIVFCRGTAVASVPAVTLIKNCPAWPRIDTATASDDADAASTCNPRTRQRIKMIRRGRNHTHPAKLVALRRLRDGPRRRLVHRHRRLLLGSLGNVARGTSTPLTSYSLRSHAVISNERHFEPMEGCDRGMRSCSERSRSTRHCAICCTQHLCFEDSEDSEDSAAAACPSRCAALACLNCTTLVY